MSGKKGITLITAVILIVFASAIALSTATFITQRFSQSNVYSYSDRCIYLAQAGLHYAIYQYRSTGTPYSGTVSNIDGSGGYAVVATSSGGGGGGQASLLEINATASYLSPNKKDILGITLRNTSASTSITLSQMIIYIGSGSEELDAVRINGLPDVWTTDTVIGTSPVTLNMNDVTIPANTTRTVDYISWKHRIDGNIVYWGFIMGDLSTTSISTVYPPSPNNLTISSMGKTTGSNIYRTINAVYNPLTGNITSCSETNATVP